MYVIYAYSQHKPGKKAHILHDAMKIEGGGSLEVVICKPNYTSSTKLHVITS
jgi:hypothetical protein